MPVLPKQEVQEVVIYARIVTRSVVSKNKKIKQCTSGIWV